MQLVNILFLSLVIVLTKVIKRDVPLEKKYLYLMLFTLPWINERGFGPLEFGFTIYPHYVFAFCFIFVYLVKRIKTKNLVFYRTPLDLWLGLFIVVMILSVRQIRYTVISPLITYSLHNSVFNKLLYLRSLAHIASVVYMIIIYWFMVNIVEDKPTMINCLKALFISALLCVFISLFPFLMYFGGVTWPYLFLSRIFCASFLAWLEGPPRLSGIFTEPLLFGVYILTVMPVHFCLYKLGVFRNKIILGTVAFIFVVTGVFCTMSKTALGSFLVMTVTAVFLWYVYSKHKKKILLYLVLTVLLLTAIALPLTETNFGHRLKLLFKVRGGVITADQFQRIIRGEKIERTSVSLYNWPTLLRLNNIMTGILMFKDYPCLGVGWGNYLFNYFNYKPDSVTHHWSNKEPTTPAVDSLYVRIMAETGLMGMIVFTSLFFKIIFSIASGIRKTPSDTYRAILVVYLAVLAGVAACYGCISHCYITHMWVVLAMTMAVLRLNRQERDKPS